MNELLENAEESIESAEYDIKKGRYNSSVSSFFRAAANLCDYIIYTEIKILPKNHNERFQLLEKYFPEIHNKLKEFFHLYRESYNLRLKKEDALKIKEYVNELKNIATNKE